jgi:hypothetical protein
VPTRLAVANSCPGKIKASGKVQVHVLTDAEKKAWVANLMPVHKEMQSRFGKDFIDKIYRASGFTPSSVPGRGEGDRRAQPSGLRPRRVRRSPAKR